MLGRFLRGHALLRRLGHGAADRHPRLAHLHHGRLQVPRELNWLTGAVLLLLTLALAFTGQLLRWDQTAVWSVIVGAAQAARMPVVGEQIAALHPGGDTIGGATLSRFFAFHVFFIPAIVFAFIGLHLALVLRHGISERTRDGAVVDPATYRAHYASLLKREGVPFWPDAAWRDVVFGAAVTATIVLLALIVGPPDLGPPPDPSILEAYPRPDWYFLWYFALLALAPNNLESLIIVLGPLVFGAALLLRAGLQRGRAEHAAPALGAAARGVHLDDDRRSSGSRASGPTGRPTSRRAPLPASIVRDQRPEVVEGARLFREKGCQFCHQVEGYGGRRGPDLSDVAARMKPDEITARITNGGPNMPAYVRTLTPAQVRSLDGVPVHPQAVTEPVLRS